MSLQLHQRLVHAPVFESFTPQKRPQIKAILVIPEPAPGPQVKKDRMMDLMTARVTKEIEAVQSHQARLAENPDWQELAASLARSVAQGARSYKAVDLEDYEDQDEQVSYHDNLRALRADYYASIQL